MERRGAEGAEVLLNLWRHKDAERRGRLSLDLSGSAPPRFLSRLAASLPKCLDLLRQLEVLRRHPTCIVRAQRDAYLVVDPVDFRVVVDGLSGRGNFDHESEGSHVVLEGELLSDCALALSLPVWQLGETFVEFCGAQFRSCHGISPR